MSLPHLLLVDDSEAILAYEKAALSGHYTLSTAVNGLDALSKIYQIRPAAVLLDLSMPEMDGDEVLAKIKADPEVSRIPVIVVSSEKARAEACLKTGAAAYLPKPIRADELVALVTRTLEQHKIEERKGNMAILFVGAGPIDVGVPLDAVKTVLLQPETQTLPAGPSYLSELFEWHGQPVCVLDLAHRLGVEHEHDMAERKIVIVQLHQTLLGLCVDRVRDPEEFSSLDITSRSRLSGSAEPALGEPLMAVVRTPRGTMPIIDPRALLSRGILRKLPTLIREVRGDNNPPPPRATVVATSRPIPRPAAAAEAGASLDAGGGIAARPLPPSPPVPSAPVRPPTAAPVARPAQPTATPSMAPGGVAKPAIPRPPSPPTVPPSSLGGIPGAKLGVPPSGPISTKPPIADPMPIGKSTSQSKSPR